jgi:RNA polymerase primary sigma factor
MSVEPAHQQLSRPTGRVASDEDSGLELVDSLSLYFRGVGRVPRLSRAQERELFRRKDAGDDRAKRLLIEAHLRLVIWIARQYGHHNVPVLDLIQEGNLALTRAVERFDYRLGFRLSTYATLLIRQAIEQAADRHARIVPVPVYIRRQIRAVRRSQQILRQRLNREPLLSEIAAEAGLDWRRVAELLNYEQQPISLETPVGEERSAGGSELLEDHTKSAYPEATIAERVQREEVRSVLNSLDDRLRLVLQLRFGLAGQPPQSLVEVGRELGVTAERARQLEARALDKLRNLAPDLRDYLEVA